MPNELLFLLKQVVMWWAGLMRGAVSMALAYNQVNAGVRFTCLEYLQLRKYRMASLELADRTASFLLMWEGMLLFLERREKAKAVLSPSFNMFGHPGFTHLDFVVLFCSVALKNDTFTL